MVVLIRAVKSQTYDIVTADFSKQRVFLYYYLFIYFVCLVLISVKSSLYRWPRIHRIIRLCHTKNPRRSTSPPPHHQPHTHYRSTRARLHGLTLTRHLTRNKPIRLGTLLLYTVCNNCDKTNDGTICYVKRAI
jgi:hypothetical protein